MIITIETVPAAKMRYALAHLRSGAFLGLSMPESFARSSSRLRRNADGTACSMSLRLSMCDNILANRCWSPYVTARHASGGLGRWQPALQASRRLRSRSKATQRSSIAMDSLDGRFASISAPTAEHLCIGKLMPDRTHTSLRSERSLIRTSPRHRCPYSRSRSTLGCSFRME